MGHDRGQDRGLASLASLFSGTAAGADLPDASDDLLTFALGRDLEHATLRILLYSAVIAAILAAIIVLFT